MRTVPSEQVTATSSSLMLVLSALPLQKVRFRAPRLRVVDLAGVVLDFGGVHDSSLEGIW